MAVEFEIEWGIELKSEDVPILQPYSPGGGAAAMQGDLPSRLSKASSKARTLTIPQLFIQKIQQTSLRERRACLQVESWIPSHSL